jgi:cytochrome c-type biogenesis protein
MSPEVIGKAISLGILTSISPCPLATNIAAISFIGRRIDKARIVLASGLLYVLGRTIAYVGLAFLILAGLLGNAEIARFLQRYLNQILGPLLILVGLVLLEMLGTSFSLNLAGKSVQDRASRGGVWWAGALGIIFALSFCPVSAGFFFGGLLPLAVENESRLVLPSLFGLGTALPVIVFAFLMAFASNYVGRAFNRLAQVERWVRRVTGVVFILAGIYYCLTYIYGLRLFG